MSICETCGQADDGTRRFMPYRGEDEPAEGEDGSRTGGGTRWGESPCSCGAGEACSGPGCKGHPLSDAPNRPFTICEDPLVQYGDMPHPMMMDRGVEVVPVRKIREAWEGLVDSLTAVEYKGTVGDVEAMEQALRDLGALAGVESGAKEENHDGR